MDFQSHYSNNPLNSMNYQFQNISLQNGPQYDPSIMNGTSASAAQPLSRQTSIMDSIGIQRSSSPFVDPPSAMNTTIAPSLAAGAAMVPATASITNKDPMLSQGNMFSSVAHDSVNSSPYPSRMTTPNVLNSGLFASIPPGVSGISAGGRPLPGLLDSQWRYIDSQGQIQGPFGSGPMSQWYASGYFQPSLQISRVATSLEPFGINSRFISLGDLISKVNNFQDPFHAFDLITTSVLPNLGSSLNVPLPPTAAPSNGTSASEGIGATPSSAPASVSLQQQQISAPRELLSEDYTHDEILKLKDLDGGYYHDTLVQIPTGFRKQEKVNMTENSHQQEVTRMKDEKKKQEEEEEQQEEEGKEGKEEKEEEEEKKRNQRADEAARELLEQENEVKKRDELKRLKKSQKQQHQKENIKESSPLVKPTQETPPRKSQPTKSVIVQPAIEVKTTVAPWADKVKNTALPKIPSISELQKREELEKIERERQERIAANKLKEQVIKEDRERQELKSVLTWADRPKSPGNTDIKSQSKQEEKKKPQKQTTVTLDEFNDPEFLKQQAALWEEAQKSKNKRSTLSSTSNGYNANDQNAWTTVMSKSSHRQSNGANHQKATMQAKSYISPDKLRVVGSSNNVSNRQIGSSTSIPSLKAKQTQSAPTYPGNASISIRQEFLRWCRSRMQLNASVRKDAVLEVLLSLPARLESMSIISDTINSNSSAMDGRRFAEDFIRRRREVEKQIKDPLTWAEVLSMPEGDDDDWEFQVVSKRKGRKH